MQKSMAVVGNQLFLDPVEIVTSAAEISPDGNWIVLAGFEGNFKAVRFATVSEITLLPKIPFAFEANWTSSLNQAEYEQRVLDVQAEIKRGQVYQVNLCRILSTEVSTRPSAVGLWQRIEQFNPSRFSSFIDLLPGELDEAGLWFVSASPELFLAITGNRITSAPIKGTAENPSRMLEKDYAENVMITDMVRNDLGRIAETGTVVVDKLLELEEIPGMVQLVSTVSAQLASNFNWHDVFAATFPPASVTGAPKIAALELIQKLEPVPRHGYCGAFGLIQPQRARLAVGIRSFELIGNRLRYGTGAGITLSSDPTGEWNETELKAKRLIQLVNHHD